MKKVKSGSDISFSFNVKVTDKTTVDEIIREASDIIKVRFAEYKVEPEESEDERIRKELIEQVGYLIPDEEEYDDEGRILPTYHKRIERYRAYLEKQKEQKSAEWSEEDEAMIKSILYVLESYVSHSESATASSPSLITSYPTYYKEIDWLKSLRPQPHWKPSEEQMVILEKAVEYYHNNWTGATIREQKTLASLLSDLQKLL